MGLPCMHIIQKQIDQRQPLNVTDTQYYWRFYKPRPTRNLTAEAVWDSWPPNLP